MAELAAPAVRGPLGSCGVCEACATPCSKVRGSVAKQITVGHFGALGVPHRALISPRVGREIGEGAPGGRGDAAPPARDLVVAPASGVLAPVRFL